MLFKRIKLKWYKDIEEGYTKWGSRKAVVWRAKVKNCIFTVYPVRLYEKGHKGWEYKIEDTKKEGIDYDSIFFHDPPYKTAEEAKKLAEEKVNEVIEEKNKREWEKLKEKLKRKFREKIKEKV